MNADFPSPVPTPVIPTDLRTAAADSVACLFPGELDPQPGSELEFVLNQQQPTELNMERLHDGEQDYSPPAGPETTRSPDDTFENGGGV